MLINSAIYLAWADTKARYKKSVLGPLWLTLGNLIGVLGLSLVWGAVLKEDLSSFVPLVSTGLVLWQLMAGCLSEGPVVFVRQAGMIRNVVIPPWFFLLRAMFRQIINLLHNLVIVIGVTVYFGIPVGLKTLLSLIGLLLVMGNLCWLMYLLGMLGARFRDVEFLVGALLPMLFFISPVVFRADRLPPDLNVVWLNPLSYFIDVVRVPFLGGFALGLQAALQRNATWVWLMDDDAVPRPGALAALVQAAHDLPDNAGALCSAVYEFGALALMHRRTFGACLGWEAPIGGAQYQKAAVPIDTGSFVGFLVKAEVVRAVGLPDASFFLAYDDTDYSLRIRRAGWSIWLVPASQIDHLRTPESRMRACAFGLKHYYNIRNRLVVVRRYARCRFLAGVIATVYGGAIWGRAKGAVSGDAVRLLLRAIWDGWRGSMRCERL